MGNIFREFDKKDLKINYDELIKWLDTLQYEDFHNNVVIKKGYTLRDISMFKRIDREYLKKITYDMIIELGEHYIVDIDGHLTSMISTNRKYKLAKSGRVVRSKFDRYLVKNKHSVNGYWVIPDEFYELK